MSTWTETGNSLHGGHKEVSKPCDKCGKILKTRRNRSNSHRGVCVSCHQKENSIFSNWSEYISGLREENKTLEAINKEISDKLLRIVASDKIKEADAKTWALCRNLVNSKGFLKTLKELEGEKE